MREDLSNSDDEVNVRPGCGIGLCFRQRESGKEKIGDEAQRSQQTLRSANGSKPDSRHGLAVQVQRATGPDLAPERTTRRSANPHYCPLLLPLSRVCFLDRILVSFAANFATPATMRGALPLDVPYRVPASLHAVALAPASLYRHRSCLCPPARRASRRRRLSREDDQDRRSHGRRRGGRHARAVSRRPARGLACACPSSSRIGPAPAGLIGTEAAARAPADGYTILFGATPTHVIAPLHRCARRSIRCATSRRCSTRPTRPRSSW